MSKDYEELPEIEERLILVGMINLLWFIDWSPIALLT